MLAMYVRFRNYILIYETFFLPHSFLTLPKPSFPFERSWNMLKSFTLKEKANESGLKFFSGGG